MTYEEAYQKANKKVMISLLKFLIIFRFYLKLLMLQLVVSRLIFYTLLTMKPMFLKPVLSTIFFYGTNLIESDYIHHTESDITSNESDFSQSGSQFSYMLKWVGIVVATTVLLLVILLIIINLSNRKKKLNKEDKLKFIDVMTSLKNRNYLNYNIKSWDENAIYPQSIVIIDLNNIKYINDNYGHAEGDEVIKGAANILMINQLENTDIVRTDGNEFLIYMVGYDEKKVIEYTRHLSKELKELPHEFGATLGYSMIVDDIKTIDDAINEATLSMRQAKEKL